tara:strand:+ start:270 stop:698 length:429 start_codon:yes stop_codon:yes gene_type:complete
MKSRDICAIVETSCGLVLINFGTVLLLQYPQGHWDLPKGHVEKKDKNKIETAKRELKEETGIDNIEIIEGFEFRTEYTYQNKGKYRDKEVWWFIAKTDQISVCLSHEHQDYLWLEWDQAIEQITHNESRSVLTSAKDFLKIS